MKFSKEHFSKESINDLRILFELDNYIKEGYEYVKLDETSRIYKLIPITKEYVKSHRGAVEDPDLYAYRQGFLYIYHFKKHIDEYVNEDVYYFYHKLNKTQKEKVRKELFNTNNKTK